MSETRTNAQFAGLREQRDAATNHIINLVGELAVLKERNEDLEKRLEMELSVNRSLGQQITELNEKLGGVENG